MLHREHHLHEAGNAGGLERVADVGLHAADRNLCPGRQVFRHQPRQRAEFGGIPHLRARGVGLDVLNAANIGGVGIGPLDR